MTTKSADNANESEKELNNRMTQSAWNFRKLFKEFTGYDTIHFTTYTQFTAWLHRPMSGSALGMFRMLYGLAMLIDLAEERGGSQLDVRFGELQHCHFPLFHGMQAMSFPVMGLIYLGMWLGALGIALGYRFRLSCLAYIVPYWYIFLLDKPAWNNHSYLFGLVGSVLLFSQAHHCCSLDKYLDPQLPDTVPYWNYFLVKFQFFILYVYAGMKKLTAEWLSGYAMSSLSRHWLFVPFRALLSAEMTDLLIVHWFTAIFDFWIAFLMTWERTRWVSLPFMISFHLMNSRLFVIGMFPWVCLAELPLYFASDWPSRLRLMYRDKLMYRTSTQKSAPNKSKRKNSDFGETQETEPTIPKSEDAECIVRRKMKLLCNACSKPVGLPERTRQLRTAAILMYCAVQLFLPYSHFITQGYNNWTDGLYGYSWNMMVHSYDTILTSIKIVDNNNADVHYLNPYAFTQYDRWTKYADMAWQYARCIETNIRQDHFKDPQQSPLSTTNISIYFDIWCSMNGRFQQRVFDPRVDLLRAEWSPLRRTTWSLPLLNELNHMRPKLKTIAHEVLNWNNYSDVIFVADFPGLTLDNFISPDLINVSLTILEGNVRYKSDDDDESFFLTAGKTFALRSGVTHHVTTIGSQPSCYLYTYINRTMLEQELILEDDMPDSGGGLLRKPMLPLWEEFMARIINYKKFLVHIGNCLLYLLYNVPIPMDVRDRN